MDGGGAGVGTRLQIEGLEEGVLVRGGVPTTMTITSQSSQHDILRVSTGSNPTAVAGAVAGAIRHHGAAHVQVVGAGALNQAVKAVAIAQGYLDDGDVELVCVPHFADIEIDGEARTAIRLDVEDRQHRIPGHPQPV